MLVKFLCYNCFNTAADESSAPGPENVPLWSMCENDEYGLPSLGPGLSDLQDKCKTGSELLVCFPLCSSKKK